MDKISINLLSFIFYNYLHSFYQKKLSYGDKIYYGDKKNIHCKRIYFVGGNCSHYSPCRSATASTCILSVFQKIFCLPCPPSGSSWLYSLFCWSLSLVSSIAMTSRVFYLLNYMFFFCHWLYSWFWSSLSLVSSTDVLYMACHLCFSSGSCLLWREFFRCVSNNFWSLLPVLQCHVIIPISSDL